MSAWCPRRSHPTAGSISGCVALERGVVHIHDVEADPEFTYLREAGFEFRRTMLGVPLLRGGEVAGVIVLQRPVVRPFSERQINLVTTFADQAMIALENARLFNETQEALERRWRPRSQSSRKVISRSVSDAAPVFETILDLCRRPVRPEGRRRISCRGRHGARRSPAGLGQRRLGA